MPTFLSQWLIVKIKGSSHLTWNIGLKLLNSFVGTGLHVNGSGTVLSVRNDTSKPRAAPRGIQVAEANRAPSSFPSCSKGMLGRVVWVVTEGINNQSSFMKGDAVIYTETFCTGKSQGCKAQGQAEQHFPCR